MSSRPRDSGSEETQPLLGHGQGQGQSQSQSQSEGDQPRDSYLASSRFLRLFAPFEVIHKQFRFVPLLGCLNIFLNEGEWFFKQTPNFRAVEAMYCIDYYKQFDPDIAKLGRHIPEKLCRHNSIQDRVAVTTQMILFVRLIATLISAVPLGYIGDRKSRKLVLVLYKIGTAALVALVLLVYLTYPLLPIWVLYFAGLGSLIGGNFDLNLATVFATYIDVMPSQSERTTLFFVTTAMQYAGQAVFAPLAAITMNWYGHDSTPEISLFCSLGIAIFGAVLTISAMPDTLRVGKVEDMPGRDPRESPDAESLPTPEGNDNGNFWCNVGTKLRSNYNRIQKGIEGVGMTTLLLFALSILCSTTGIKSIDLLGIIQYPVVRIGWSFSQTNLILTIQALVYMANYFVILPAYNRLGKYYNLSALTTSLCIMMLSACILIVGSVLLGFTTSNATFLSAMVIYTLGTGLPVVTQTYIANSIGKQRMGRVLAIFSMFAVLGKMAAAGLGPHVFSAGNNANNQMLKGLIFWYGSSLFGVSIAAVSAVALRNRLLQVKMQDSGVAPSSS